MVHSLTLEDGDQITIAQQSNSSTKKVLTRTEPMMYEEPKTVSTPTPTPNPDSTKTDVTQENANTSTAPQDELTAAPSGAPEGEGDKIEPSKQKTAINRPKTAVCRIKKSVRKIIQWGGF